MRHVKRLFTIVMSLMLLLTNTVFVNASEEIDMSEAFELAEEFLTEYYYAIDMFQDYDFSKYTTSENFLTYVEKRVNSEVYASEVYTNIVRYDYSVEFDDLSFENLGSCVRLYIGSTVKFRYAPEEEYSIYGEGIYFLVNNGANGLEICDWYVPLDPYDEAIRGDILISDPYFWDNSTERVRIYKSQQLRNESILANYELSAQSKTAVISNSQYDNVNDELDPTAVNATLYAVNHTNVAKWAKDNWDADPPTSGDSSQVSTYKDFHTISSSAWDCTNFASHAILYGGAVIYDTGNSGISSTGWYYRDTANRSSSWSGVKELYNFLTKNTTKGPAGKEVDYVETTSALNRNFTVGDLIQLNNGEKWSHTTIITEIDTTSGVPKVTYRSSSERKDYNVKITELEKEYPGGKRVVKITGYYK